MFKSLKVGMGFGLASATITTLGLMIGLESSTSSKLAVIGGILTIAIADSCSDALGVHIAKESEGNFSNKQVWQATFFTFLFKAVFACSFLAPVLFFPLRSAIYISLVWGALILIAQSYNLARDKKTSPLAIIGEHVLIAALVMVSTHFVGIWIASYFK
jgi:VIT1/CCC1 family predicted Fe2+/Mn2+ transporter